ncbi:NUDIX domain-containing protein [Thalassotalea maritima]|uniref:NUDIX domain-containing protein n=1 Tax=Thalassotalea maritima TaxID=3242416 RepID=UPI003528FA65
MKSKQTISRFTDQDFNVEAINSNYQGFFRIDEYRLRHKLFNGEQSPLITREIFERGDAVVLMVFDRQAKHLLLIQQFRPGAIRTQDDPWMLEFIAGMFAPNEQPIEVAIREAKEEANIDIDVADCEYVMEFLPSPGGCSEKLYLYVAYVDLSDYQAGQVHGLDNEHEDIKSYKVSLTQALRLLEQGKVNNASTIIGLQWLALHYKD